MSRLLVIFALVVILAGAATFMTQLPTIAPAEPNITALPFDSGPGASTVNVPMPKPRPR